MHQVLEQLGFTWRDIFFAGIAVGVWWGGRNRKATGERLGAVEEGVSEVRGLLKAIRGKDVGD